MRRRRSGLVCFLVLAFCVFFVSAGQSLFAQARDASSEPSIFPLKQPDKSRDTTRTVIRSMHWEQSAWVLIDTCCGRLTIFKARKRR
jgi:hypothetical protein